MYIQTMNDEYNVAAARLVWTKRKHCFLIHVLDWIYQILDILVSSMSHNISIHPSWSLETMRLPHLKSFISLYLCNSRLILVYGSLSRR